MSAQQWPPLTPDRWRRLPPARSRRRRTSPHACVGSGGLPRRQTDGGGLPWRVPGGEGPDPAARGLPAVVDGGAETRVPEPALRGGERGEELMVVGGEEAVGPGHEFHRTRRCLRARLFVAPPPRRSICENASIESLLSGGGAIESGRHPHAIPLD
jgi:hypothetical protein